MAVLYGIGVGSGDPELLTLKAVKTIQKCGVIVVPAEDIGQSVAYKICSAIIHDIDDKELLGINMPMTRDEKALVAAHEHNSKIITDRLDEGKDVAFLTLGDPTIYSTFTYVQDIVSERGYKTEIVNGITAFLSAASLINSKLVIKDESLHIISGVYDIEAGLNLSGTKVIMKAGNRLKDIKKLLHGTNNKIFFIENCGMDNEVIIEGIDNFPDSAGYYSMVVVMEKK